jgi:GT2 family glycosyltransferase
MPIRARSDKRKIAEQSETIQPEPAEPAEPQPPPLKASVIVVSHNQAARLRACLEALERSGDRESIEVLVVDNGSTDGAPLLEGDFSWARFIRLPRNFGLTKALNIGIRAARADYLFVLHDDTEVFPETVRQLWGVLDAQQDVGAVAPLLVDGEGRPAPQVGRLPPDLDWAPVAADEPEAVDYSRGAALMFRSFFFKAMRQIDERYGQFGGDAELCYQIRRAGKKILIMPDARARHYGHDDESGLRAADVRLGQATFLAKRLGFWAGLKARIGAAFGALARLRLREFRHLLAGEKIDGSQP